MLHRTTILLFIIFISTCIQGQVTITLRKSFIDSFKNKVTITSDFAIFYAHVSANPAIKDGDLHFSGYDKKIGLPVVAELMNAKGETDALDIIHTNEGKGEPTNTVKLTGAWRLWAEHISKGAIYEQGLGSESIENTNPDHVFEIHPVSQIDNLDLTQTLKKINGFKPYKAKKAFGHYLNIQSSISSTTKLISIVTKKAKFNYADFWISLNSTEKLEVTDGLFVNCTVLDSKFKPGVHTIATKTISADVRMVFVKDSEPYNTVKSMSEGQFLHVTGIPRICLRIIDERVSMGTDLTNKMPIEMIVVAIIN